jgi:Protein of unknown function (DUF2817)
MSILSPTYASARTAFLEAAAGAGAEIAHLAHPETGLEGEELAIDVAWFGPRDAENVLMVMSATHGVEGFAGSALQTRWLNEHGQKLPENASLLFVHAVNPFGFSWTRRVNEDNVDLNRNFIDFAAPLPHNEGYDTIADLLVPNDWSEESQATTTTALLGMVEEKGFPWLQQAASGGQYSSPTGIFFGGVQRTWSNLRIQEICETYLGAARRVAIIDLHTGLGPWGHGDILTSDSSNSETYRRLQSWYGDKVSSVRDNDSVSAELVGECIVKIPDWIPQAQVTAMAIEYGVIDPVSVLQALRADAWLWAHGDPRGAPAIEIRSATRAAFADDEPAWIGTLWEQFEQRFEQAVAGLSQ